MALCLGILIIFQLASSFFETQHQLKEFEERSPGTTWKIKTQGITTSETSIIKLHGFN